jgi:hypothetical protein
MELVSLRLFLLLGRWPQSPHQEESANQLDSRRLVGFNVEPAGGNAPVNDPQSSIPT